MSDEEVVLRLTRAEAGLVRSFARGALKKHQKNLRALERKFGDDAVLQSGRAEALRTLYDKADAALEPRFSVYYGEALDSLWGVYNTEDEAKHWVDRLHMNGVPAILSRKRSSPDTA